MNVNKQIYTKTEAYRALMNTTGLLGAAGGQTGEISQMDSATEGYVNASNLSGQNKSIKDN